ncbi:MAG: hypothetical protein E6R03_00585 [Hyphomicrobiaceae bacterium]|nr:MAG: hypothetical protein E6R03_00585 [Hyphomicrobiaceae bacterium]
MRKLKASLEPMETKQWEMALENLKEMQPQLTLKMMESGVLKKTLDNRVIHYFQTAQKLRETMDEMAAQEAAQMEILTPINPNRDRETPLTPEQEAKMNQWRSGLQTTTS